MTSYLAARRFHATVGAQALRVQARTLPANYASMAVLALTVGSSVGVAAWLAVKREAVTLKCDGGLQKRSHPASASYAAAAASKPRERRRTTPAESFVSRQGDVAFSAKRGRFMASQCGCVDR